MDYQHPKIREVAALLSAEERLARDGKAIVRAPELAALFAEISSLPADQRASFGKELNSLRLQLEKLAAARQSTGKGMTDIDVTAPFDQNTQEDKRPALLSSAVGSKHPLMIELEIVLDIFQRMGFKTVESRQLDDDYHMFSSLNFPEGHPARDDYDTFTTTDGLIAPAHTSTMQNRVLNKFKTNLETDEPIAVVIPGRVFRNEDLDARHEHTFYQLEGVYVDREIHAGNLIATLKTFLQEYYQKELEVKTQPFYFPFTEPSFEFALSCPFCDKKGCNVCGYSGWIELLGCGMIHPNVLSEAGIDPNKFTGFAWGGGIDRLVMMKYDIEDIRHFESGKLEFLRQFR